MPSFLITDTASTELYTLSLHDALPVSSHFGGGFINEVRGYLSTDRSDASGFLELPEGRVQVGSNLSGSVPGRGIATLAFGGNPGFPQQTDATSGEVTDEVSWLSAAA